MGWWGGRGSSGFGGRSTSDEVTEGIDASGLTAIVTGGFSGIGEDTARVLALRGAYVVIAGRNLENGRKTKDEILKKFPGAKVEIMELDLSSLTSVRRFANEFLAKNVPLNILINNAGIMLCPYQLSVDGVEMHFATNHLGHFLLTNLLLDKMKETAKVTGTEGRIINVSSMAYMMTYRGGIQLERLNEKSGYMSFLAYGQSKLANILHANELTKRLSEEGANVTANSLHPGEIKTGLPRYSRLVQAIMPFYSPFMKSIPQGAATTCYLALHPSLKGVSGEYFHNCNVYGKGGYAKSEELAKKLWDVSVQMSSK
ncbi:hypothetical protein MPTK1_8g17160 [Marchantia polymorpha subsp. ruderalis]|uniref:Uncharacterized protein n=2 Tax=Marchantia polymorpha TaxID=3197 RepID=A0A176WPY4_MARPO|nr:hypothetical protein AXG93_230s1050 [Marchantia polymorpha subsp. ruderalis]PTQ42303.1 hypothetical protein MARPO_0030s0048 [Marchantia polymorpha]BBN20187.1 hypothetical protein Mp_8g17160 [Marchantia polymorpha subsp. ruderalis]|eukprot:PTQ42303.1 hypothetical protein MARPO_0030s0048 [Marchantia polymorpha]